MNEVRIGKTVLKLWQGNIVGAKTEAIVNAANSELRAGSGVCGAIYEAADLDLLDSLTRPLGGCPTGDAVMSSAGRIHEPTRYVIHAVGPIYSSYSQAENEKLLAAAYRKSLALAHANVLKSLAFPAISTGVYGYPADKAAPVVVRTVVDFLKANPSTSLELVMFVFYSSGMELYQPLFERL